MTCVMICRNLRKRTLFWPIAPGARAAIAPGELFEVHPTDLDAVGMREVLRVFVKENMVRIEATDMPVTLN
jgi:hypothetical protein